MELFGGGPFETPRAPLTERRLLRRAPRSDVRGALVARFSASTQGAEAAEPRRTGPSTESASRGCTKRGRGVGGPYVQRVGWGVVGGGVRAGWVIQKSKCVKRVLLFLTIPRLDEVRFSNHLRNEMVQTTVCWNSSIHSRI